MNDAPIPEDKRLLRMLDEATDADGEIAGHREGNLPSDAPIPPDIHDAAQACRDAYNADPEWFLSGTVIRYIAAAILAERRRCAQILVDNFAPNQGESMDPYAVLGLPKEMI